MRRRRFTILAFVLAGLTITGGASSCAGGGGGQIIAAKDGGEDAGSLLDGSAQGSVHPIGPNCLDKHLDKGKLGPELCDTVDNDCDGKTDELVSTLCPKCLMSCEARHFPAQAGWAPSKTNSHDVTVDANGALSLTSVQLQPHAIWVANTGDGTVSKLDAIKNVELARYVSALPGVNPGIPWSTVCAQDHLSGNCPSQIAVDQNFDAYVANRAFESQGSVTKYADDAAHCRDKNLNGMIDTSSDVNGDGRIDINDPTEFIGEDDECILWTVPVGTIGGLPQALAVGEAKPDALVGDLWVGLFNDRKACRLDPNTGEVSNPCVELGHVQPYGATSDSTGRVWFMHHGPEADMLGYVDPALDTFYAVDPWPAGGCEGAGVASDAQGRIYVTATGDKSTNLNCNRLYRYDLSAGAWQGVDYPGSGTPRAVAADGTHIWMAVSNQGNGGALTNQLHELDEADLSYVKMYSIPKGALEPVGVGVSFDGSIWAICKSSDQAARLDPKTGTWIVRQVGMEPYTYGDFAGFGLHTFTQPAGEYHFTIEGCTGVNKWYGVNVSADQPKDTKVEVWVRSAATSKGLTSATWIGPFTAVPAVLAKRPGPVADNRYLEVELRLGSSDAARQPRVSSVDVVHDCVPLIQ